MTNAEIETVLESTAKTIESLAGRMVLIQAQLFALEEAFLHFEGRRGVNSEELRKALQHVRTTLAEQRLVQIGDTSPQTAKALDIEGLLAKIVDQIKSSENP
jgi:hypothetical protein